MCHTTALTVSPVLLSVLALRHFLNLVTSNALAYVVWDRAKTNSPGIYSCACKVYPGFWCNSGGNKRHSSHFVGAPMKKMHIREKNCNSAGED